MVILVMFHRWDPQPFPDLPKLAEDPEHYGPEHLGSVVGLIAAFVLLAVVMAVIWDSILPAGASTRTRYPLPGLV